MAMQKSTAIQIVLMTVEKVKVIVAVILIMFIIKIMISISVFLSLQFECIISAIARAGLYH